MAATQILVVVIAAIGLTIFAERRQIQAPLLLTFVGLLASFLPGMERLELEPEIILGIVLPPLLYSAAADFSFFSFMRRLGSILNLGIALVAVTTIVGGVAMAWLLPALSIPTLFILTAVVSPPDAVSAASIGRKLGLPARLMTILKGESLINDAAALVLFTVAVALATQRPNFIGNVTLYFLYAAGAGIVIGLLLGAFVHRIRRKLTNPTLITALAIVVPFAAYALAEEIQASGVMAVVFAGFSLGHNAVDLPFSGRIQEREVWRVADALLEAFVFAYMGLQLRFVVDDALHSGADLPTLLGAAGMMIFTLIAVRAIWIGTTALLARLKYRLRTARAAGRSDARPITAPLSWRENVVLSWSGMRGVVTVAAAAGTPLLTITNEPLPGRDVMVAIAFLVAIGTLLFQGLTLPWLIRALRIDNQSDAAYVRQQTAKARAIVHDATARTLEDLQQRMPVDANPLYLETLRKRLAKTEAILRSEEADTNRADLRRLLEGSLEVLAAQKQALIDQRNAQQLDDEVMRQVLEEIDLEQAVVTNRLERAGFV